MARTPGSSAADAAAEAGQTRTPAVQFSNFSLLEDRETRAYEITTIVWGEFANVYQVHVYGYVIALN